MLDRVTDLPIAGARVELLSGKTLLGTAETDTGGATRFLETETPGIAGEMQVRCAATGYERMNVTAKSGDSVTVNLTQADVRSITVSVGLALPGLRVLLTSGVESVAGETD